MNGRLLRQTLFPSPDAEQPPLLRRQRNPVEASVNAAPTNTQYMRSTTTSAAQSGAVEPPQLCTAEYLVVNNAESGCQDYKQNGNRPDADMPFSFHIAQSSAAELPSSRSQKQSVPVQGSHARQRTMENFSQIRPRKSLHQRLNLSESDSAHMPQPQKKEDNQAGLSAFEVPHLRRPDIAPYVHSRSASVLSSVHGRQEDDISSIMMRGATDLRNAKFEVEEQRREIALLQSQVESARNEKDEVYQRLKAVKDAAQRSLHTTSESLEAMRLTVAELKCQSETSFAIVNDARSSLADVQKLRDEVAASIQSIAPHMEGGDEWTRAKEMRTIISSLEMECSNGQQVSDLLRDRLQSIGAELLEAKARVTELEAAQVEDRATLGRANEAIARSAEEVVSLAGCLKTQRIELYETLSIAAESEARFEAAGNRIAELQAVLKTKDEDLRKLEAFRDETERLRGVIETKDSRITQLEGVQTEISDMKALVGKRDVQIAKLDASNASIAAEAAEKSARLHQVEDDLGSMRSTIESLKEDLAASKSREEVATVKLQVLHDDKRAISEQLAELQNLLTSAHEDLQTRSGKLQEADARYQALEDRFEDQSVTLRITREAVGDAQDRLHTAETSHVKQLAEATGRLELEIATLKEQRLASQNIADAAEKALERQQAALNVLQEEHAARIKESDIAHAALLAAKEEQIQQLEGDLASSQVRTSAYEITAARLEDEMRELRNRLTDAQKPSPEAEAELRSLRTRVAALEAEDMKNTLRAKTIESRYRTGDLNDEEKAFITALVRTSQAINEQELVANRNELRRRDNTIKELRAKVHLLESTLARHLNAPKIKTVPPSVGVHSMIDPTAWMSSGQSSSPTQAPDRDDNPGVDVAAPVNPAPIPVDVERAEFSGRKASVQGASKMTTPYVAKLPSQRTPLVDVTVAPNQPKPNFSRIATDCSDEILDFDDEPGESGPASALGKRTKPSPPPRQVDDTTPANPLKRLNRPYQSKTDHPQTIQPRGSKTKARKRR
ncbi:hypothetical protein GY45DRAFT_1355911 [Cubamyces sp. BRFM 1775]|nr:hypothetical protein GY45DRAFT_1355911 [Cubamyces sp. BRFM 1775]